MNWNYGDEAMVRVPDESGTLFMKPCAIVGITPVDNPQLAESVNCPLGTVLCTVEFSDGSDALVREDLLLPLPD